MKTFRIASMVRAFLLLVLATLAIEFTMPQNAEARAGGSRSMGRSMSRPAPSQQYRPQSAPPPQSNQPQAAPGRGGFMRGLAGGVAGGVLGSMLFSSFGHAAPGGGMGGGGSGFGLIEIILVAGLAYLAFRWWKSRQMKLNTAGQTGAGFGGAYPMERSQSPADTAYPPYADTPTPNAVLAGPGIDSEDASDIFFKVQGAFTRRDLSSVGELLGQEIYQGLNQDVKDLRDKKQINRLENISVRKVETIERWNEGTAELSRVRFTANLLDYTVDETTSNVISGSATEPVKFEENWLFCRATPYAAWQLVGIQQV